MCRHPHESLRTTGTQVAIARAIGKSANTTNTYRTRLKRMGVIAASGRGGLVFTIPYLPRYLEEGSADPWESADDGTPYVMS